MKENDGKEKIKKIKELMDNPAGAEHEEDAIMTEEQTQKFLAKYDKSSATRHFEGTPKLIMRWLCVAFTIYMLLINTIWLLPPQVHRASFVAFIIVFVFLLYPSNKKNNDRVNYIPWYDLALGAIGAGCFLYYAFNFEAIARAQMTFTTVDLVVAIVGIAVLFVACYRIVGLPLVLVVLAFLSYTWFGQFIPGQFGHAGFRLERVFTFLFYTTEGVIGIPTAVASTFLFVFMLFGAFMAKTGIGQFFIDISNSVAGKATGGPAKMAVIVSVLTATISGSSVANTVASGSFTIPMMKRMGYNKNFAGAVEASASTGGQIVPPILGAAAFLMAEITGIPYSQIALAAVIPAMLYFITIFSAVHFEAKKKKLKGLPPEEIPKPWPLIKEKGQLCVGIIAIVVFLNMGFTPTRSALYAILVSIVVSMLRKDTRLTPTKVIDVLETGTRNSISVAIACATAGMIIGVVTMTGLGMAFVSSMISLGYIITHEYLRLLVILVLCMFASLILGLGMPTTAKYVIMATVTAPVLYMMGVPMLAAHMFVFYFGVDADITPPVALASYAAAGIAKGDPMKTSITAVRLGIAAYLIPFFFVLNPQMLFIDATVMGVIQLTITGIVGVVSVAAGLAGYFVRHMRKYERILAVVAGISLAHGGLVTDLTGIIILAGLVIIQKFFDKDGPQVAAA